MEDIRERERIKTKHFYIFIIGILILYVFNLGFLFFLFQMRYLILLLCLLSIIKLITSSILIQKRWANLNITAVSKANSSIVRTNLLAESALYGTNSPFYPVNARLVAAISLTQPPVATSSDDSLFFNNNPSAASDTIDTTNNNNSSSFSSSSIFSRNYSSFFSNLKTKSKLTHHHGL